MLATALRRAGRPEECISAYRQAVTIAECLTADFPTQPKHQSVLVLAQNNLAWVLVTCTDPKLRDPVGAVELSSKAVELGPKEGTNWNTLGVARYRNAEWKAARDALTKSMELLSGQSDSFNTFFLAMAHWQLGDKPQARIWYDKAVQWMEKNQPKDEELIGFRAEAAALLGVDEKHK
jgi:tetratricopeptide (TPR) repeat protein